VNPRPMSESDVARYPGFRRLVVAGPSGDLTADGRTPEDAAPLEAMFGELAGSPAFVEHWRPTPDEISTLVAGGSVRLILYVPQLPVHSLDTVATL